MSEGILIQDKTDNLVELGNNTLAKKFINKALFSVDSQLAIEKSSNWVEDPDQPRNNATKLKDVDRYIKSYRRTGPRLSDKKIMLENIEEEYERFEARRRSIEISQSMRNLINSKTLITNEEDKEKLPELIWFKPKENDSKQNKPLRLKNVCKVTSRSMKSLQNYKMPRSHAESKVVHLPAHMSVDNQIKSKKLSWNISLPYKENKYLDKIKREEAVTKRESFKDLDKVQHELNLMNMKVLSTIKRKKLKPFLSPLGRKHKHKSAAMSPLLNPVGKN